MFVRIYDSLANYRGAPHDPDSNIDQNVAISHN